VEKQLLKAIIQLDEKEVLKSIKKGLAQGLSNISLQELMQEGMEKVGILYERGDYFIGDLIMAGEIFKKVLRIKGMSCDEVTKKTVYKQQTSEAQKKGCSNCPLCAIGNDSNKTRIYKQTEMDADHVTAWSNGGATDISNCTMLCKTHNRAKGNK